MSVNSVHRWTDAENVALQAALDHACKQPFHNLAKSTRDVLVHMENAGITTMTTNRIRSKITTISGKVGKTGSQYIRWLIDTQNVVEDYRDKVDCETRSPSFSDITELSDPPSPRIEPPEVEITPDLRPKGITNISEQRPQTQQKETKAINNPSTSPIDLDLQELYRYKVHEQPPLHETVKYRMRDITRELKDGIDAFIIFRSVSIVGSENLNAEAIALSEFILWHMPHSELVTNLDNLFGGLGMGAKTVMRMYAAAALCKWVFHDFNDLPFPRPSHDLKGTFLFGLLQRDTRRMVERGEQVHWLQNVVRPTLLGHADSYRKNLFRVFVSLASSPGLQEVSISQGETNKLSTFENRKGHVTLWEQRVTSAFKAALELRLELELSSDKYEFRFPTLGEHFEEEWMVAAHSIGGDIVPGSKVYVCLQPAIISVDRGNLQDDPVTVSKAVVMIEGYRVEF